MFRFTKGRTLAPCQTEGEKSLRTHRASTLTARLLQRGLIVIRPAVSQKLQFFGQEHTEAFFKSALEALNVQEHTCKALFYCLCELMCHQAAAVLHIVLRSICPSPPTHLGTMLPSAGICERQRDILSWRSFRQCTSVALLMCSSP